MVPMCSGDPASRCLPQQVAGALSHSDIWWLNHLASVSAASRAADQLTVAPAPTPQGEEEPGHTVPVTHLGGPWLSHLAKEDCLCRHGSHGRLLVTTATPRTAALAWAERASPDLLWAWDPSSEWGSGHDAGTSPQIPPRQFPGSCLIVGFYFQVPFEWLCLDLCWC